MSGLKAQGLKPGVPDICIPLRTKFGHPGAYIEQKRKKGCRVDPEQRWWLSLLAAQGYHARVAFGLEETMAIVDMLYGPDIVQPAAVVSRASCRGKRATQPSGDAAE
jgi:hypothetical protein